MVEFIINIWVTGGWVMIPLAILSLVMYSISIYLFFNIKVKNLLTITDIQIKNWILNPAESPTEVRHIFEYIQNASDLDSIDNQIREIEISSVDFIQKHFSLLLVLVNCAPLLGLLGTVTGIIGTFEGISAGTASSEVISKGISECLITTETGLLLIAIPGLLLAYLIKIKKLEFLSFLYRVESIAIRINPSFQSST
jgi:biopolymer transport protein ExbB